jgi:hypothetical protein
VMGNNTAGSKEFNEPNHAGNVGGKSIWYCWTAGSSAGVVFDTIGSSFDTLLAVYTGNSMATLALVTENDDIAGTANRTSRVTLIPTPGTIYWIAVDGYNGASGSVVLNILPANDDFANCQMLSGFQGSAAGFNFGASSELSEPFHAGQLGGRSVWYCWTAPLTGNVEFNTLGSTFDTLLAVYTGVSLNSLSEVASNDDFSFHRQSRVMFSTIAGTDYRIAVDSYGGATGDINLAWGYQCRLSCATASSGTFLITVQGLPLQSYTIESSDDFNFWFSLGMVDTGPSGSVTYNAGPIATPGRRFYRAALLP